MGLCIDQDARDLKRVLVALAAEHERLMKMSAVRQISRTAVRRRCQHRPETPVVGPPPSSPNAAHQGREVSTFRRTTTVSPFDITLRVVVDRPEAGVLEVVDIVAEHGEPQGVLDVVPSHPAGREEPQETTDDDAVPPQAFTFSMSGRLLASISAWSTLTWNPNISIVRTDIPPRRVDRLGLEREIERVHD